MLCHLRVISSASEVWFVRSGLFRLYAITSAR
jgi:hypothetical protein